MWKFRPALPVHRRQFLHGTGLAVALFLSGCFGGDTEPDDGPSPLTADELDIEADDDGMLIVLMVVENAGTEPHDGSVTAVVTVDGETTRATTEVSLDAGASESVSIPTDVAFETAEAGIDINIEFG